MTLEWLRKLSLIINSDTWCYFHLMNGISLQYFSPLQIRLHGSNGPMCSGRHSGSKIEHTNSWDRFEHFDSIKYWKCSKSWGVVIDFDILTLVKSYGRIPRQSGNVVDWQIPEHIERRDIEKKQPTIWNESLIEKEVQITVISGDIESAYTFSGSKVFLDIG